MRPSDDQHLACPSCLGPLHFHGTSSGGRMGRGCLTCGRCREHWPVRDGLPRLLRESDVRGSDRLMRVIYDGLPFLHDVEVRTCVPLSQLSLSGRALRVDGTERTLREAYLPRIELGALTPRNEPYRILEIGIGTGANVPLVLRALPAGVEVELWGIDLSVGMLRRCRRRVRRIPAVEERLAVADAHCLPFSNGAFDRVFHVGATNSFRDPATALAEMARVARPGTPIVIVDEQLDAGRSHSFYHRAWFSAVTFYSSDARSPRHLLPPGATVVADEQLDRFFYCLAFKVAAS